MLLGQGLLSELPGRTLAPLLDVFRDCFPDLLVLLETEEVVFVDADEVCGRTDALDRASVRQLLLNHVLKPNHAVLAQKLEAGCLRDSLLVLLHVLAVVSIGGERRLEDLLRGRLLESRLLHQVPVRDPEFTPLHDVYVVCRVTLVEEVAEPYLGDRSELLGDRLQLRVREQSHDWNRLHIVPLALKDSLPLLLDELIVRVLVQVEDVSVLDGPDGGLASAATLRFLQGLHL